MASPAHWAYRRRLCPLWNDEVFEGESQIPTAFDVCFGVLVFQMIIQAGWP